MESLATSVETQSHAQAKKFISAMTDRTLQKIEVQCDAIDSIL